MKIKIFSFMKLKEGLNPNLAFRGYINPFANRIEVMLYGSSRQTEPLTTFWKFAVLLNIPFYLFVR